MARELTRQAFVTRFIPGAVFGAAFGALLVGALAGAEALGGGGALEGRAVSFALVFVSGALAALGARRAKRIASPRAQRWLARWLVPAAALLGAWLVLHFIFTLAAAWAAASTLVLAAVPWFAFAMALHFAWLLQRTATRLFDEPAGPDAPAAAPPGGPFRG